jgi:hypothetical protein
MRKRGRDGGVVFPRDHALLAISFHRFILILNHTDTLRVSEERIIYYWQEIRQQETFRFDCEVSRTLLGRNTLETQWEKPAFTALMDAAEMIAIQRGIERWSP